MLFRSNASAAQTPVDLQNYTAWRNEAPEVQKVAVAAGGNGGNGANARMSFARRPILEMPPVPVSAADPASDTFSPGAEFEPVSPLDVPAFLRRQNEG